MEHLDQHTEGRLLQALRDGRFASGTVLGQTLGIGRAGVGRAVDRLRQAGLRVDAVRGRGYRIPGGYTPLDPGALREAWRHSGAPEPILFECLYRPNSTNEYAMQAGGRGTGVVFAEGQGAGRGRLGRTWSSPLGNLYLSVVHDFDALAEAPAPLALAVAVAIAEGLRRHCVPVTVKWPNDLLVAGRKVGGILTELRGDPLGPCRVVVGVGINRTVPNMPVPGRLPAGAIGEAELPGLGRSSLAGLVGGWVAVAAARFGSHGLKPFLDHWPALDALDGRSVRLETGEGRGVAGVARGIDEQGRLRVQTERGLQSFASGEAHLAQEVA